LLHRESGVVRVINHLEEEETYPEGAERRREERAEEEKAPRAGRSFAR
jgi:hypothetical protein